MATNNIDIKFALAEVLQTWTQSKIDKAKSILEYRQANASRNLSQSIQSTDVLVTSNLISIGVKADDYYTFVDQGVKGLKNTKRNSGKYSFKTPFTSKAMVDNIQRWIAEKPIKVRQSAKQPTKDVIKQARSLAFVISRSIKQKGTEATYFWSDTFNQDAYNELATLLSDKLGGDFEISFEYI